MVTLFSGAVMGANVAPPSGGVCGAEPDSCCAPAAGTTATRAAPLSNSVRRETRDAELTVEGAAIARGQQIGLGSENS